MKISICLCIRDCEKYIDYLNDLFFKIENKYNKINFEYFMYENNSIDNTKNRIINFYKNRQGKYLFENIKGDIMIGGIQMKRGTKMANLRNKLKHFHRTLDSDFVVLLDADVIFTQDTIIQLINTLKNEIVMATPFCICNRLYIKNKSVHYYDSFAVISMENISYRENINTCLFKSCKGCINHRKVFGIKIDKKYLFDDDKIIETKSCFGSFAILKTKVYNEVSWENTICEHHSFCNKVSKYGKIVINPMIKTFTTVPELCDYNSIDKVLNEVIYK
jgi:cellulose synthase/poly-beta-1,6-N-acetylglucosamine synthase-like glycosyltransferase